MAFSISFACALTHRPSLTLCKGNFCKKSSHTFLQNVYRRKEVMNLKNMKRKFPAKVKRVIAVITTLLLIIALNKGSSKAGAGNYLAYPAFNNLRISLRNLSSAIRFRKVAINTTTTCVSDLQAWLCLRT